jgi:hypothetical protein
MSEPRSPKVVAKSFFNNFSPKIGDKSFLAKKFRRIYQLHLTLLCESGIRQIVIKMECGSFKGLSIWL